MTARLRTLIIRATKKITAIIAVIIREDIELYAEEVAGAKDASEELNFEFLVSKLNIQIDSLKIMDSY